MAKAFARGYVSSNGAETTPGEMTNIFPEAPEDWTYPYIIKKLSFMSPDRCTLIINEVFEIVLEADRGFENSYEDVPISSLVIKEAGITYEYIGAY